MSRNFLLKTLVCFVCGTVQAHAGGLPPATQNRVHLGSAWTPGNPQLLVGFDSRLTQSISVDVGGFYAPIAATKTGRSDPWVLRHGLYVDPGVRIPHRNKSELKWDLIVRAGFGPVWVADGESRFDQQINPGLNGGGDLMFRYKDWGLRFEGRVWYVKPFSRYEQVEIPTVIPQAGASLLYQF